MTEPVKVTFNYAEHQSLAVLRKSMRDPARAAAIARSLLKDQSKELAYHLLKQASKEIADLLVVSRAFTDAAGRLAKEMPNDKETSTPS